jgi:Uma2 family endonuclease
VRATSTRFTRADYEKLPEGFPAQLVEGEFVKEPSPVYQHQRVAQGIWIALLDVVGRDRGVISPVDIVLDEFNVFQPDVCVFAAPLAAHQRRLPIPILVVDVLSPSTAGRDRNRKTRHYLAAGVREVWLVDPDVGAIEVHTRDGVASFRPDDEAASSAVPGFRVTGGALTR